MKFRVFYGCYLDGYAKGDFPSQVIEADSEHAAEQRAYELALNHVSGWVGMSGFGPEEEDYVDEDDKFHSWAYDQAVEDAINDVAEYWVEAV